VDAAKEDPLDFVLWKRAKPHEPTWPSRWGAGRPGWHIECSAMSSALLGEEFDIHGGGQDLQFPHHENEIAQSEGASGARFARYWMHNGFVRKDDEKMSKSLGNFSTIREVLGSYDPEVVRFFILRAHYRSPLNYSDAHLDDAKQSLSRLYTALKGRGDAQVPPDWATPHGRRFREAMDDDFGTPEAVAVLHELANEAFQGKPGAAEELRALGGVLGMLQRDPHDFLQGASTGDGAWIDERIAARKAARDRKDFAEADRIRAELLGRGIVLEDADGATAWRRK
jgi:cysteinyl-tRNA synthetase